MNEPVVLRRSRKTYEAHRTKRAPLWVVPLVGGGGFYAVALRVGVPGWIGGVVGLAVGGVALVLVWRSLTGVSVRIDERGLAYQGLLGTRRWTWDRVGGVLVASQVSTTAVQPEVTWVVPLGTRGRRLFQVTSMTWAPEALTTLTERVGEHTEVLREPGPSTLKEVAARHPGAFNPTQRRPLLAALVIAGVLMVVVVGGTFVGYALWGPDDF